MFSFRTKRGRGRAPLIMLAGVLLEAIATKLRAGRVGGNVVVRCHEAHLFTTIWVPGASIKSLRFGWWRLQRCPVGRHWSIVTPVKEADLTGRQRRGASRHRDIRIP
jgi:hypothetical protein